RSYGNTVLMSEIEGRDGWASITGLNGLLLGLARKRGLDAACLMGEIPDYLSGAPFPYPPASKSVLEVLTKLLGFEIAYNSLDEMGVRIRSIIDDLYEKFPPEIKDRIEQRKSALQARAEVITTEDEKWIKEHIDEFFKGSGRNERAS
ncbi:MAG: PAC2 family protein, partial [Dehalococcoidales bacterium]|nr:PAC2 family protein [Dehalococcoidales bacterium]